MSTPQERMQNTQDKVRVNKSISLYTDNAQLGLIMRPVKMRQITDSFLGAKSTVKVTENATPAEGAAETQGSGTTREVTDLSTSAQGRYADVTSKTFGFLRAELVSADSIRGISTSTEVEYGPMIQMPLPEKIKDAIKINYSTVDLGTTAAGALFGEDVSNAFKDGPGIAESLSGNASYLIRTLMASLAPQLGGVTQKFAGNIPNPFSAAIFEKVSPRNFSFSWTVQPQNAEESKNIKEIVNALRYWSLPNPSENRLILDVPYEWELSFVGTEFLYSFSRCVMTSLDIDFSPNGFNAFMKETAAPQSVTISVEFQEIFPLDKETIDKKPNVMRPGDTIPRAEETVADEQAKKEADIAKEKGESEASKEVQKYREEVKKIKEGIAYQENRFAIKSSDGTVTRDEQGNAQFPTTFTGDTAKRNVEALNKQLNSAQNNLTNAVVIQQSFLLQDQ